MNYLNDFEKADLFIVAAEGHWPEDEAFLEAEHYVVTVLQKFDERTMDLDLKLFGTLQHYHRVFADDQLTKRFVAAFNLKVPEFCSITKDMLDKVLVQQDLFD